jgi:hypothetical protein
MNVIIQSDNNVNVIIHQDNKSIVSGTGTGTTSYIAVA